MSLLGDPEATEDADGEEFETLPWAWRDEPSDRERTVVGLTVLSHPDATRIGDRAALSGLGRKACVVSRVEPPFLSSDGSRQQPLEDRHISRRPVLTVQSAPDLRLLPGGQYFELDGEVLDAPIALSEEHLRRGMVLVLAERVALLLHEMSWPLPKPLPGFDLVGISAGMVELQHEVQRVRDVEVPVLLRGETGTGKELVARAIHEKSARADGPFVAVNMAALPPNLAAAELFGSARGAFTGADRARPGLIREASGGTLFLDEVGEMPSEVQGLLLRFVEDREVRPVGGERSDKIDVRIVAATDSDLDRAVREGVFSQPLLQRFSGYEIRLPRLRERQDDLGVLLHHFLAAELQALGKEELLEDPGAGKLPWLPAALFHPLVRHHWPGNVRELRNLARRLVVRFHTSKVSLEEAAGLLRNADEPDESLPSKANRRRQQGGSGSAQARRRYRDPMEVSDKEIEDALRDCQWEIKRAAEELGLSRASLYGRIDAHPHLRRATELESEEIEAAWQESGGNLDGMVDRLKVGKAGLRARMRELGLPRSTS